jgi:hypothetical protein
LLWQHWAVMTTISSRLDMDFFGRETFGLAPKDIVYDRFVSLESAGLPIDAVLEPYIGYACVWPELNELLYVADSSGRNEGGLTAILSFGAEIRSDTAKLEGVRTVKWASDQKQRGCLGFELFPSVCDVVEDKYQVTNMYLRDCRYLLCDVLFKNDLGVADHVNSGMKGLFSDLKILARAGYFVASLSLDTIAVPYSTESNWKVIPLKLVPIGALTNAHLDSLWCPLPAGRTVTPENCLALYMFRLSAEIATCLCSPTPRDPMLLDVKGKCYPAKNGRNAHGITKPGTDVTLALWRTAPGFGALWTAALNEYGLKHKYTFNAIFMKWWTLEQADHLAKLPLLSLAEAQRRWDQAGLLSESEAVLKLELTACNMHKDMSWMRAYIDDRLAEEQVALM